MGGQDRRPALEGDQRLRRRLRRDGHHALLHRDQQAGERCPCAEASTARAIAAQSWQSALGRGINVDTAKADQWAYGPIAQYKQILTTDAKPLTVYVTNTGTGFHPPHHETVYRSDDGGDTWRATFFQDPRFKEYNVAPNYVTASVGQSFKGGETPFGAAICNRDPDRLILVWSESYLTHNGGSTWFNGDTYPAPGQQAKPGSAWVCDGLVVTTTWNYYIDPFEANRHYIAYTDLGFARSLDAGKTWIWWDKDTWAPWRNTCYEIAFDPEIPGKMWGGFSNVHDIPNDNIISERHGHNGPGGVCLSRDFGASWKAEAQGLPLRPVTSIVLDPRSPKNARTLYAGVFLEGVYKSTDDGKTWTLKKTGLGHASNMRVSRVILHQDGTLFAMICAMRPGPGRPLSSEGVGLYRSKDGAETWEKINASPAFPLSQGLLGPPAEQQHYPRGHLRRRRDRPIRRPLAHDRWRQDLAAYRPPGARRPSAVTSTPSTTAGST